MSISLCISYHISYLIIPTQTRNDGSKIVIMDILFYMPVVLHLFMSTWSTRDLFNSTYRKHAHRITSFAKDATSWSWACIFDPWKLDAWWHFKLGITPCENIRISLHYVSPMLWRHTCQAARPTCFSNIHWIISCLPSIWQGISQECPCRTYPIHYLSELPKTHGEQITKGATHAMFAKAGANCLVVADMLAVCFLHNLGRNWDNLLKS